MRYARRELDNLGLDNPYSPPKNHDRYEIRNTKIGEKKNGTSSGPDPG